MFFTKKEISKNEAQQSVVVVGRSLLAFYLAAILQEKGIKTEIKVSSDVLKKFGSNKNIVIKHPGKLKENIACKFVDRVNTDVDFCFIASHPEDVKKDFVMLTDEKIKKAKIINLTSCLNHKLFEKTSNVDYTEAFFNGWLVGDDKVQVLTAMNDIRICCEDKIFKELKNLFFETNMVVVRDNSSVFKQKFLEKFAINLLLLVYEKDMSAILYNKKDLKKAEESVKEICGEVVGGCDEGTDKKVLQSLYDVPDGYRSEFSENNFFDFFLKGGKIDAVKTPVVYEMMSKIIKK